MGRRGRTATVLALATVYLGAAPTQPAHAGDPGYVVVLQESVSDPAAEIGDLQRRDGVAPQHRYTCLLYTSPSPRDLSTSRMPSSA